jgi:hypothetical protein
MFAYVPLEDKDKGGWSILSKLVFELKFVMYVNCIQFYKSGI